MTLEDVESNNGVRINMDFINHKARKAKEVKEAKEAKANQKKKAGKQSLVEIKSKGKKRKTSKENEENELNEDDYEFLEEEAGLSSGANIGRKGHDKDGGGKSPCASELGEFGDDDYELDGYA